MASQSELFSNIYDFLEKGYDAVNARGGSYQQQFALLHQEIGKMWNRSGHELNYPKYSTSVSTPTITPTYRSDRKTIVQELAHMLPYYNMHHPCHMSPDIPKPNPMIPSFRNEFADLKARPEPVFMPPPPAKTTGLKPHCKFCKNNGERPDKYLSHQLSTCPILTTFNCTNCNQKGHTQSHCTMGESRPGTSIVRILSEHNKPTGPSSH